jgi:hypothetical protein
VGAGTTQGRRTQRCMSRRADRNETRSELGRISVWKLERGEGNGQVDRLCWPFGSCADKCPRSPRGLLLLSQLLQGQSRLRVTVRRARIVWEQREADRAGRGRTRMGEQPWPQLEVGERGHPGRREPLAVGRHWAWKDWWIMLHCCCLLCQSGAVRGKPRGSELAGLEGWAFFVSNSLFDAGWSFFRCDKQEMSWFIQKKKVGQKITGVC